MHIHLYQIKLISSQMLEEYTSTEASIAISVLAIHFFKMAAILLKTNPTYYNIMILFSALFGMK